MTFDETRLLGKCLDSLDWLFDGHASAADVWDVLSDARQALRETAHREQLDQALAGLLPIIRSRAPAKVQRDKALIVTGDLRGYLAELLPIE